MIATVIHFKVWTHQEVVLLRLAQITKQKKQYADIVVFELYGSQRNSDAID